MYTQINIIKSYKGILLQSVCGALAAILLEYKSTSMRPWTTF